MFEFDTNKMAHQEEDAAVRRRFAANRSDGLRYAGGDEEIIKYNNKVRKDTLGLSHLIPVVAFFCVLTLTARFASRNLPEPQESALGNETRFSALRARRYLNGITHFGPRTAGSYENDILAVDYIMKQLEHIKNSALLDIYDIDIEVQHPSGGFQLFFLDVYFTESYMNLTNIIVHLAPKDVSDDEILLVNSHFDTQIQTDGASDATASCAVMLEMLSCLSKSPRGTIKHGIVFLFNGAEESILPGSHGFITQHPLSSRIKAFVNLEASGSGGKELVFQTGPDHPWLIHVYAQAASRPYASIVAQEIFQAGLVPSDTDFRIFRDFGSVPGIDVAFTDNGYVYHTKYDTADIIPDASLQHSGDNMLALIRALAASKYLKDSTSFSKGDMVFFDFLGAFMILYSHTVAETLNLVVSVLALAYVAVCVLSSNSTRDNQDDLGKVSVWSIASCFLVTVLTWLIGLVIILSIAVVVSFSGHSLSWYSKPKFVLLLYGLPYIVTTFITHHVAKEMMIKNGVCSSKQHAGFQLERSAVCSYFTFLSLLLIVLTLRGLLSAAFVLFYLLCPLAFNGPLHGYLVSGLSLAKRKNVTIMCHLLGVLFPSIMALHSATTASSVFVPILGRAGSIVPPDLVAAAAMFTLAVFTSQYLTALLYMTDYSMKSLLRWFMFSLLPMGLAVTGLVFPFSGVHPVTPKRFAMQHVLRNFHNADGTVAKTDSMLWLTPFDYLGIEPLTSAPGYNQMKPFKSCDGAYCGMPSYFPLLSFFRDTFYLDAPPPLPKSPLLLEFKSRSKVDDKVRLHIVADGPARMNLYLKVRPGVKLSAWSFDDVEILPLRDTRGDPCYFVIHTSGFYHSKWVFWLEFQTLDSAATELADMGVGTHFLQGEHAVTPTLTTMVSQLPDWAIDMSWVSTYDHWTI